MKLKNIIKKVLKAVFGDSFFEDEAPKTEKPYVPVSKRICPLCGEFIGFDASFISVGDVACHVRCVDMLEKLENGEQSKNN